MTMALVLILWKYRDHQGLHYHSLFSPPHMSEVLHTLYKTHDYEYVQTEPIMEEHRTQA